MYYSIYAMCIAEAEAAAAVVVVALQALIYLWFTRSHIRPFVRMEEQWNSMLCIAARTAVYVRSTSLAYTILYIYILKLHWHSDNSPLLTASACCSFLSPSLSLSLLFSFCFFCLIVRSFVAAAVVAVVCDEKPVHKIDDYDDSDGSDGDDDYNGWFFEDMNRVKSWLLKCVLCYSIFLYPQ